MHAYFYIVYIIVFVFFFLAVPLLPNVTRLFTNKQFRDLDVKHWKV